MGWRCDFSNIVCDDGLRLLQRKAHTGLPYGQPDTVAIAQEGVIVVGGNELVFGMKCRHIKLNFLIEHGLPTAPNELLGRRNTAGDQVGFEGL